MLRILVRIAVAIGLIASGFIVGPPVMAMADCPGMAMDDMTGSDAAGCDAGMNANDCLAACATVLADVSPVHPTEHIAFHRLWWSLRGHGRRGVSITPPLGPPRFREWTRSLPGGL